MTRLAVQLLYPFQFVGYVWLTCLPHGSLGERLKELKISQCPHESLALF